jgi:large subunit ribosomal protein L29
VPIWKEALFRHMKRKEQIDQLRDMNVDELKEQADALKESLFRLKFRKTLGVGETISDIRREKKTLARVYTLINKKEAETKA